MSRKRIGIEHIEQLVALSDIVRNPEIIELPLTLKRILENIHKVSDYEIFKSHILQITEYICGISNKNEPYDIGVIVSGELSACVDIITSLMDYSDIKIIIPIVEECSVRISVGARGSSNKKYADIITKTFIAYRIMSF